MDPVHILALTLTKILKNHFLAKVCNIIPDSNSWYNLSTYYNFRDDNLEQQLPDVISVHEQTLMENHGYSQEKANEKCQPATFISSFANMLMR